jgi:hypothetical protein
MIPPKPDTEHDSPASITLHSLPVRLVMDMSEFTLEHDDARRSNASLASVDGLYGSRPESYSSVGSGSTSAAKKYALPDGIEEHKEFCEQALDVSRRFELADWKGATKAQSIE